MEVQIETSSVRRTLFGPVDHEQLRKDLSRRLRDITEQDSRRWNFDFYNHAPLSGRFQWEPVSSECAAEFYGLDRRESTKNQSRPAAGEEVEEVVEVEVEVEEVDEEDGLRPREGDIPNGDQENCPRVFNTCLADVTSPRRKRPRSRSTRKEQQNARITDFFAKRRRSTETKSVLGPFLSQSTEAPLRTIR
ncbi:unnamed protein product [Knipowitschia caucasica]|uniref:Cyclin-dependent kinase inhibitor domain-containing protein n=1 Tax=Knipowitschia caucasica TaxID=637954 RepID=A0AAV2LS96_KNICA